MACSVLRVGYVTAQKGLTINEKVLQFQLIKLIFMLKKQTQIRIERYREIVESVIELAEEGAFGELLTCEADCECVICECRKLIGESKCH